MRTGRVYTIDDLMNEGFTLRNIRYLRTMGVLPPAHGRGPNAFYSDVHMKALRQVKEARDARRTLKDIAEYMSFTYPGAFDGDTSRT